MHPNTPQIAAKLRGFASQEKKFAFLCNAYAGESAVLFSCGPSFKPDEIAASHALFEDRLVIAIKQTHHQLGDSTDFHLYNPINHTRYAYGVNTISFLTHCPDPKKWRTFGPKPDLEVGMDPGVPKVFQSEDDWLVCNRRYDEYLFSKQLERPWGPGIILESALYFALHLGVARLACVGWDVSEGSKKTQTMAHFYETESERFARRRSLGQRVIGKLRSLTPRVISLQLRQAQNYLEYRRGGVYNRPKVYPNENESVWAGSYDLYRFLQKEGLEMSIASDCCRLDGRIPRTTLAEFFDSEGRS